MEEAEEARLRGNEAFVLEDWDGAIGAYSKGILKRSAEGLPPDRRLFSNRSAAYIAKYKAVKRDGVVIDKLAALSVADARTAASIAPDWPKAWYRLYTAYVESSEVGMAVDILKEGLAHCPHDPDLNRALAIHQKKKFDDSECPGDTARLIANEKFKRGDWDGAIANYTMAIDAAKKAEKVPDRRAFSNRSAAYLKKAMGINDEELFERILQLALADAEMCIQLDPTWPKAWYRKGIVLLEDGRPAYARKVFLDGLKQCPGDGDLLEGLKQAELVLENEGAETDWEDEQTPSQSNPPAEAKRGPQKAEEPVVQVPKGEPIALDDLRGKDFEQDAYLTDQFGRHNTSGISGEQNLNGYPNTQTKEASSKPPEPLKSRSTSGTRSHHNAAERKAAKLEREAKLATEKAAKVAAKGASGKKSARAVRKAEKASAKAAARARRASAKIAGRDLERDKHPSQGKEAAPTTLKEPAKTKPTNSSSTPATNTPGNEKSSPKETARTRPTHSSSIPATNTPGNEKEPAKRSTTETVPEESDRTSEKSQDAEYSTKQPPPSAGDTLSANPARKSESLYEVLGVASDANEAVIKRAYYVLARKYHPDKNLEDPRATAKFQRLGEAYQILSNPDTRSLYDKYGESAVAHPAVDTVDPSTLFAMVFGSDQFVHLVGELQLATLAVHVDDDGNAPTQEFLETCQNERVEKLAAEMLKFLQPWTSGDRKAFLKWAKKEAVSLAETNFGPALLYSVGYVYMQRAHIALGKTQLFGIPALLTGGLYRTHKINSQIKANAAASKVMNQHRRFVDKVMKLNRAGKEMGNEESQRVAVEMAENAVDMMWKISVLDIQRTIESVIDVVLSGRDLAALTVPANYRVIEESESEDGSVKVVKKRSVFGKRSSNRVRSQRDGSGSEKKERSRRQPRHRSGNSTRQPDIEKTIRERASALKELGKIFMAYRNHTKPALTGAAGNFDSRNT